MPHHGWCLGTFPLPQGRPSVVRTRFHTSPPHQRLKNFILTMDLGDFSGTNTVISVIGIQRIVGAMLNWRLTCLKLAASTDEKIIKDK